MGFVCMNSNCHIWVYFCNSLISYRKDASFEAQAERQQIKTSNTSNTHHNSPTSALAGKSVLQALFSYILP